MYLGFIRNTLGKQVKLSGKSSETLWETNAPPECFGSKVSECDYVYSFLVWIFIICKLIPLCVYEKICCYMKKNLM